MKTQCPHCKTIFNVPPEYKDKKVKCRRCDKDFKPVKFEKPPIVIPNLPSRGNFLTNFWTKSPTAFKAGFLTTLGVVSALVLSFYVYRHIIITPLATRPINTVKKQLSKHRLFPITLIGVPNFLRGRYLSEYQFFPDATRNNPFLSVWTDRSGVIVGVSTDWLGASDGYPADIDNDRVIYSCGTDICDGFKDLTGFDLTRLPAADFIHKEGKEVYQKQFRKWLICIVRTKSAFKSSKMHKQNCRLRHIDPQIYHFLATAQNW